ncbi:hypothetical protein ACFSC6_18160 [Rufibacter sediminis]|uniref:Uncharacterized protein n=1 Tax=Rufibacter sediminis TaxID=2762756 RepID=A0ABR6VQH3_9BACT|nr:hypothetical protein [Rufibacter sediminis]MBC3539449.1 hypothetical protein [Rufibacter sediminis]
MKIESNSHLNSYLNQIQYKLESTETDLPEELEKLIDSGFRIEQDCILIKDFQYFGPGDLDTDFKKCEYEVFLNDIHVDDYYKHLNSELEYLPIGLKLAKRLHHKLTSSFDADFRIVVSFCETTYSGEEIDVYGGCVVKFHKIRPSKDDEFKFSNLENFESEAVMTIE